MAILASFTALGGADGDVHGDKHIVRVFSDGNYAWADHMPATDDAAPFDISKDYEIGDTVAWLVPSGGPFITGAPQSKTLVEGETVLLQAQAAMAAGPLDATAVLNTKYVGEASSVSSDLSQFSNSHHYAAFPSSDVTLTDATPAIGEGEHTYKASHVAVTAGAAAPGILLKGEHNTVTLYIANHTTSVMNVGTVATGGVAHRIIDLTAGTIAPSAVIADSGTGSITLRSFTDLGALGKRVVLDVHGVIGGDFRIGAYIGDLTAAWEADMTWFIDYAIAPNVTLTATGGSNTVDGGNPDRAVVEGVASFIQLDAGPGNQLDLGTPPTIDVGSIEVIDAISGTVMVTATPTSAVITFATKASVIATTLNLIASFDFPFTNINASAVHNTGIDFTKGDMIRMRYSLSSNGGSGNSYTAFAPVHIGLPVNAMDMHWQNTTTSQNINARLDNLTLAQGGQIYLDASTTCYAVTLELWGNQSQAFAVPTATIARVPRTITQVGGTGLIGGVANYLVGDGESDLLGIGLNTSMQIDTISSALYGDLSDSTDKLNGFVRYTAGAVDDVITITEKASTFAIVNNRIFRYEFGATSDDFVNVTGQNITVGDLRNCTELRWHVASTVNGTRSQRIITPISPAILALGNSEIQIEHITGITVQYYNLDVQDMATGQIQFNAASGTLYVGSVEGYSTDSTAHVVPVGTVAATNRTITQVGGTASINGGPANAFSREGVPTMLQFGLNAAQQIDTITNSGPGTIDVINPLSGLVLVTAGNADDTITITEKASATAITLNFLAEYNFPVQLFNIDQDADYTTGIKFVEGDQIRIKYSGHNLGTDEDTFSGWAPVRIRDVVDSMQMDLSTDATTANVHINATIRNATEAAAGIIRLTPNHTCYAYSLEVWTRRSTAFHVPASMVASDPVTLTGNAGAQTVTPAARQGQIVRMQLEVAGGQMLNLATPPTIDIVGASIDVADHLAGTVDVFTPVGGITTGDITYGTVAQPLWVREFLMATSVTNGSFGTNHHEQFTVTEGRQIGTNIQLDTTSAYSTNVGTDSVGRILLKANTGLYRCRGALSHNGSNAYIGYRWTDTETGIGFGATASSRGNTALTNGIGPAVQGMIEPLVDTRIEIRIINTNSTAFVNNNVWSRSWFEIEKILEI